MPLGRVPALSEKLGLVAWMALRCRLSFKGVCRRRRLAFSNARTTCLVKGQVRPGCLPEKRKRWKQGEGIHLLLPACSQSRFLVRAPRAMLWLPHRTNLWMASTLHH